MITAKKYRLFETILLPLGYCFSALIISLAILPCALLIEFVFKLPYEGLLFKMLQSLVCGVAYFIFGFCLLVIIVLCRIIFQINSKDENLQKWSLKLFSFAAHSSLLIIADYFFLRFIKNTFLINWFFRGMGAKIGKNCLINTSKISDCNLITIGNNCVLGGDVVINGHSGEGDLLFRKSVFIGDNVTIGQYSTILAGAVIEDNVIVGANSLVMKNQRLQSNSIYLGVPVRLLKENISSNHILERFESNKIIAEENKYNDEVEKIAKDINYSQILLALYEKLHPEIIAYSTTIYNLTIASIGIVFTGIFYIIINNKPLLIATLPPLIALTFALSLNLVISTLRIAFKKSELEVYFQKAGIRLFNWETKYGSLGSLRTLEIDGVFITLSYLTIFFGGVYLTYKGLIFTEKMSFLSYSARELFLYLDLFSFIILLLSFIKFYVRRIKYVRQLDKIVDALK